MASKRSPLFSRLQGAIRKVKFLLAFNASRWIFSSILGSSPLNQRRLSLKSQPSGLLDCTDDEYYDAISSTVLSRSTSLATDLSRSPSPSSEITRSTSDASDDIDRRAEDFIANFYKHIQMERQVSLELRYCREKKLERAQSD